MQLSATSHAAGRRPADRPRRQERVRGAGGRAGAALRDVARPGGDATDGAEGLERRRRDRRRRRCSSRARRSPPAGPTERAGIARRSADRPRRAAAGLGDVAHAGDARQTVPRAAKSSAGQVTLVPLQVSATSQIPASWRQTVPAGASPSAGQAALVPLQVSATSQMPADGTADVAGSGIRRRDRARRRPRRSRRRRRCRPTRGRWCRAGRSVQAPAPSQVPSVPQLAAPVSAHWFSGSWRSGTLVQAPSLPGSAHDRQVPVQVVLQQTPCWQMPELQSSPTAQVPPSGALAAAAVVADVGRRAIAVVRAGRSAGRRRCRR